jgi:ribosome-associated protein
MSKKVFTLNSEYIRLDDLLKLTGCVMTGGQAKMMIQSGEVTVDGEVCLMRGKKLRGGETVAIPADGEEISVDRT